MSFCPRPKRPPYRCMLGLYNFLKTHHSLPLTLPLCITILLLNKYIKGCIAGEIIVDNLNIKNHVETTTKLYIITFLPSLGRKCMEFYLDIQCIGVTQR